ncbi:sodium-coupled monocarboxylate transporter 2-like isoform X2 [Pomacea canaliculata]|uniref:sodium-coupled monocarboxylate transporter 2-like isoform X2 n=1 Tax=Pomacea canaliculata TaxID=400727 RepID=UPI000D731CD2|nr:sodium-coupled monocarboxylate transporter 2-like isoform X2 [Pomacea canaliculata]
MAGDYSINTGRVRTFGPVDYTLFVLTLLISAGIGIFYAIRDRKRNTTEEFLFGGKKMAVFPVAMSLMVTFMSALTLLGNPAEIYNYNTMWWYLVVAFIFAIAGACRIFIPFFFNLGITSTFEYLEMRFDKKVRLLASSLLIFQTLVYMAFLLYAPSLALNAVTGLHLWGSVIGMGFVVTFYTTLGGMKAVLWTDTFQAGVIFAGLLAVLIQGSIVMGGFGNAWLIASNRSRIVFDEFDFDPKTRHTVWSMVVGGLFFWVYLYGINQAQVQRCLSCPSVKKAQMAMLLNMPGLILIVSFCCMIGIEMFAFYADCHPITFGLVTKTDQLIPLFVMDILGHVDGLPGVFLSCIVSGSLSSLSSGLNALGAVTFSDVMQTSRCCKNVSEFHSAMISKLLVGFYGLLAIALAWVVSHLGSVLEAIYVVFGILNGPVLGVITFGMFFPWGNKWGAFFGTMTSLVLLLWIGLGAFFNDIKTPLSATSTTACNWTAKTGITEPNVNLTLLTTAAIPTTTVSHSSSTGVLEPLYQMSYMWYTGLGMILVWGPGIVISFLTGSTKPTSIDPRLICPIFDKLFPYLPEKILKPLRFGIVHKGKYDWTISKGTICIIQPASASSFNNNSGVTSVGKEPDCVNTFARPIQQEEDVPKKKIKIGDGNINEAFSPGEIFENGVLHTQL